MIMSIKSVSYDTLLLIRVIFKAIIILRLDVLFQFPNSQYTVSKDVRMFCQNWWIYCASPIALRLSDAFKSWRTMRLSRLWCLCSGNSALESFALHKMLGLKTISRRFVRRQLSCPADDNYLGRFWLKNGLLF